MRNKHLLPTLASALFLLVLIGCGSQGKKATKDIIADNVEHAVAQ